MTAEDSIQKPISDKIDELEFAMMKYEAIDCPLNHKFFPGLYVREILMKAGTWVISCIHKTTHPYFILQGEVSVFSETLGEEFLIAPHSGTTFPGTRRVLYNHTNVVWVTIHPTDIQPIDDSPEAIAEAVERIEDEILEKRENPLIGGRIKNNVLLKKVE